MGGRESKEAEDASVALKRTSAAYRATEDEERAWMDAMSKQNNSALAYAAKAPKKPKSGLLDVKIIFVVGGPGSGKGTQCTRLSEDFNLCHLSVGDLLRAEAAKGSERGKLLDEYMKEGKIVPMEITLEVVRSAIEERKDKAGFLIDGFPRKLDQAKEFEEKVAKCHFVLYFECSEAEMTKRLLSRGLTSGRIDDNEDTIKKRLETFRDTSMPVIDYYQKLGKVKAINSERDVAEVYEDSRHVLSVNGFPDADLFDEAEEKKLLENGATLVAQLQAGSLSRAGVPDKSLALPTGSKRAVLVGLNYKTSSFKRNLGGCIKDVITIEALLKSKLNFSTLSFTDEKGVQPTAAQVLGSLAQGIEGLKEGDQFVFFFSGHLARIQDPSNSKPQEALVLSDGIVLAQEFIQILDTAAAGVSVTVILDGCLSSGTSQGFAFSSKKGFYVLSAAQSERAKEMPYMAGGAMTNTLLNLLKDNGNSVTLETLKDSLAVPLNTLGISLVTTPLNLATSKFFLGQGA